MKVTHADISVEIEPNQKSKTLARANVTFFGSIKTKGWRVLSSNFVHPEFQEQIDIKPPSVNLYGRWYDVVFIEDKELFREVQRSIYDAFHRAGLTEKDGGRENADIADQIPF